VAGETFLSVSAWKMREKEKDKEAVGKTGKEGDRRECLSHFIAKRLSAWRGTRNAGTWL
jgi:hypothetical protein